MGKSKTFTVPITLASASPVPDAGGADIIQWVNLEPDHFLVEPKGTELEVHAQVMPLSAGVKIRFEMEADPGNRPPADLELAQRAGFPSLLGLSGPASSIVAETNRYGHVSVRFRFSSYGGDRFRVKVSGDGISGGPFYTPWYVVWRVFWYEAHVMDDAPDGTSHDLPTTDMEAEMAKAFIKAVKVPVKKKVPYKETIAWESSWARDQLTERFGAEHYPHQISVMFGSRFAKAKDESFFRVVIGPTLVLWKVLGALRKVTAGRFSPFGTLQTSDWFVDVVVTLVSGTGPSTTVHLGADKATLKKRADGKYEVELDLSAVALAATVTQVSIELKVKGSDEFGVAWGNTPFLFIPVGSVRTGATWMPATATAPARETMAKAIFLHEVGHKVLMVNSKSPYHYLGDSGVTNPGLGPHCMFPDAGKKDHYDKTGTHSCVMHHSAKYGNSAFCAECGHWLRYNGLTAQAVGWEPGEGFWAEFRGALFGRRGPSAG
jgi:hypothetical protein